MALEFIYDAGLASLTSSPGGLREVRGNGTLWANDNILPGDTFWKGNLAMKIEEVEGDEDLLLAADWEGLEFTDEAYFIVKDSPLRTQTETMTATLLAVIEKQNLIFNRNVPLFSVVEYGVASPPIGAVEDDIYVIAESGTSGVFQGHENELAIKTENGWAFLSPEHGWHIDSETDNGRSNVVRHWDGTEWDVTGALAAAPDFVGNWDNATEYTSGQIVLHLGALYIALADNTNEEPGGSPASWALYASVTGIHGGSFAIHYTFRTDTTAATANTAGNLNAGSGLGSSPTMVRANITDIFGANKGAQLAAANSASTSTVKGKLRIVKLGDLTKEFTADVTSVSSAGSGARYDFVVTNAINVGTIADGDEVVLVFTPKGDKGDTGAASTVEGPRGPHGGPFSIKFIFDSATGDADPTSGKLRLGSATQNAAIVLRVNDANSEGASIVALIADIANATNSPLAKARLSKEDDPDGAFLTFNITAVTDAVNYTNLTISIIGSTAANPFTAGDEVVLDWTPLFKGETGAIGATGATGAAFEADYTVATLPDRDAHDNDPAGTKVIVTSDSDFGGAAVLYFLLTPAVASPATAAVWSEGERIVSGATAAAVEYDNTGSGLAAENTQAAIDELSGLIDDLAGEAAIPDIASASTIDVSSVDGPAANITGTTGITAITMRANQAIWLRWAGAGAITHNGSSLPLNGAASRTNEASSWSKFIADASGVPREVIYSGGRLRFDIAQSLTTTQKRQAISNLIETGTFTPTVTLVGGAGNTVPVYATNNAVYTKIGKRVWVDVDLTDDGGAEGAGTGAINIALPFAASATAFINGILAGTAGNGTTEYPIGVSVAASASTAQLFYFDTISNRVIFTGALQNNTTRFIRVSFSYPTDA